MNALRRKYSWMMMGGAPYDARVEYLQSTGLQYINLRTRPLNSDIWKVQFRMLDMSSTRCVIGSRYSASSQKAFIARIGGNYFGAAIGSNANTYVIQSNTEWHNVELNFQDGTVSFDEGEPVFCGTFTSANYNIYIFAMNENSSPIWTTSAQIKSVVIEGRMILIPVRVGQVGYMYDTVSGELFGNAGAGDFIVGPDI